MSYPRLEVLIATCGDGIERVVAANHPKVNGVQYTVCWQVDDPDTPIPPELVSRWDVRVCRFTTKGLSRNRNHCINVAVGEVLLFSDDDIRYTARQLYSVINSFKNFPKVQFITFRYASPESNKSYNPHSFDWSRPPKGAYVTSFEIAVRRMAIGNTRFNPHFGIGGTFAMGEEELFIASLLRSGMKGLFLPLIICTHPGLTTGSRVPMKVAAEVKGATFLYLHPSTWPLRMLAHARHSTNPRAYCRHWLAGAIRAMRLRVFRT